VLGQRVVVMETVAVRHRVEEGEVVEEREAVPLLLAQREGEVVVLALVLVLGERDSVPVTVTLGVREAEGQLDSDMEALGVPVLPGREAV
jgi:hypothetical protein